MLLWALFAKRDLRKRREGMLTFAGKAGFSFEPPEVTSELLNAVPVFTKNGPGREWQNVMRRSSDTGELIVGDCVWRHGKSELRVTYALVHCPAIQLPRFKVTPVAAEIPGDAGMKTVEYPEHLSFSKRFRVAALDEHGVRALFGPELLRAFAELPSQQADLSVQAEGEWIVVRRAEPIVPVEQMRSFADAANTISNAVYQAAHNSPLNIP